MGEYDPVAVQLQPAARALADACAISAGQEILDVAAGTGNLAAVAASEGAAVTASDLSPAMVEKGRARTAAEGYDVEWGEANAEELPYADAAFDCVASVFGAVFAPRPDVVASELFRVVRPGNTVGLTAWTPESFASKLFRRQRELMRLPEEFPPAELWGREETAQDRIEPHAGSVEFERRALDMTAPSVEDFAALFERAPAGVAARERVDRETWDELAESTRSAVAEANAAQDGSVSIPFEYAVIVARKRG